MLQNRISQINGQADRAATATVANGKHRQAAKSAAPSTNGSNGVAARHGGRPNVEGPPSTNGSNGSALGAHDHDDAGKFAPGNQGGPGNPFARQVAQLRKIMIDATTPERMRNVADMLYERTMNGDMAAAKLLLAYTIGKPKPAPEPDLLDEEEWDRYKAQAPMFAELPKLVAKCSPELPLEIVRGAKPAITREQGSLLGTMLRVPHNQHGPLLDRMKHMTNAQFAAEMRKLAAEQAKDKAAPSTNGSNGAPPKKRA